MPLAVPLHNHRHHRRDSPEIGLVNLDSISINLDGAAIQPQEAPVAPVTFKASSAWFWKREDCTDGDNSGKCEKPVGDQALPIGLGVGIPLFLAMVVLAVVHFRHVRKVKREEANDTLNIDMDDDFDPDNLDDLKADPSHLEKQTSRSTMNRPYRPPNGLQSMAKAASIRSGHSGATNGDPFMSTAPYLLHPDVNNSKTSLDEYSRSLASIPDENKYPTSVYSAAGTIPRIPSPAHIHSPLSREPTTNTLSDIASGDTSHATTSTSDNRSSDNNTSPMTSGGSFSDSKHFQDRRMSSRDSPFASKEDSDASDEEEEAQAHSRLERKIDEGIEHVREYSKSPFSPDRDEFDFDKQRKPTFVIQDEDDDEDKPLSSGIALGRSDTTKHFDRVKSFYKEYMEEEEAEADNSGELPSRVAPQELHVPPNASTRLSEHYLVTDNLPSATPEHNSQEHVSRELSPEFNNSRPLSPEFSSRAISPEYNSRPLSPEYKSVEPLRSPVKQTQFVLEDSPRETLPELPPSSPIMPESRVAPPPRPPPPHMANRSLNSSPVMAHYPAGQLPAHPDEPFMDIPRAHPSNGSDYAQSDYSGQPFPPSVSQQGRRSAQNSGIPLPKLADLASPHNLSETDSPIAFASQRRFKTGTATPGGSSSGASSPRLNSRFNVLDLGEPQTHMSKSGLPSPHALRQSIVLMSAVDFAPPRKFTGIRGRSSSLSNVNGGTPNGSISGYSQAPPPSRISKYVPSAHDEDMLRPTMDMRA